MRLSRPTWTLSWPMQPSLMAKGSCRYSKDSSLRVTFSSTNPVLQTALVAVKLCLWLQGEQKS